MKRKIIKQGHNTLTITLPSEWTQRFNLEAGKEIDLDERENGLFISTEKNGKTKHTELDITGMDIPTIWKHFVAIYREGYDEVVVKFDPKMQIENPYKYFSQHRFDQRYKKGRETFSPLEGLQHFVNRFIDFEIVEPGKNHVVIREMGILTGKEFDNSLRRIFLLLQQMTEETLEAIKTNNPKLVAHMHDVDINLDKFQDYCIRILNRVGNKEPRKTSLLFATLILLEMIGDEFKTISHHMIFDHPHKKFNSVVATLAEMVKNQFEIYYDLFYKFDNSKVAALSAADRDIYLGAAGLYKKADEEEKELFHHLRMIAKNINALVEIRIEMEF